MHRISPFSFWGPTAVASTAIACGILIPANLTGQQNPESQSATHGWPVHLYDSIWIPRWDFGSGAYTFVGTQPNTRFYRTISKKAALHLTYKESRYALTSNVSESSVKRNSYYSENITMT